MKTKTPIAASVASSKTPAESSNSSLEEFLLSMHRASSVVSDSSVFAENGIGLEDWAILRAISPDAGQMAQIAKVVRVPRLRVSRVISELAERGFVQVSEAVKGDRRSRTVTLTAKGTEALSVVSAKIKALDVQALERQLARGSKLFRGLLRALPVERAKRGTSE